MLPPIVGFIVGLFVQAILYGTYIATLLHCICVHERNISKMWAMKVVTIVIFMFSTIDLAIMVPMVLGHGPRALPVLSAAIEGITIHIVDAVLLYRCWVVHGQSWRVVSLPLVLWCSSLVCMSFDIYLQSMVIGLPVPYQVKQFRLAFFACHVATNVFATSATCYRILSVGYKNRSFFTTSNRILSNIGWMLACSGGLFTVTSILNLILGLIGFTPKLILYQVTFNAINFSMAGIMSNFILIYVGERRAKSEIDSYPSSEQSKAKDHKALSTLRFHNVTVPCNSSCDSPDSAVTGSP